MDGLVIVLGGRNSSALAIELCPACINPSILTMSYLWWCYWIDRCNFAKGGSIFSKCKIRIWPMKLSWKKVPEILWMSLKNFCNVPEGLAEGLAALQLYLLFMHLCNNSETVYRKISNIRCTKCQNLDDSCLVLHLSLSNLLKPVVK